MAITQIPSEFISTNAISGTIIADNAITAVHIATNAVSGTLIADNAITAVHIAGNSVTAALLEDNAVGTDQLAGIARGKIIYGDSSGDPQLLALGSNGQVLKSDGSDVTWGSISTPITALNNATENELVTVGATTTELEAESGLTWDTSTLKFLNLGTSSLTRLLTFTSASSIRRFHIDGTETSGNTIDVNFVKDINGTESSLLYLKDGKVGIGTTSPAQLLTVEGSATVARLGSSSIYHEFNSANGILNFVQSSSPLARFQVNGTDVMSMNETTVGIGTNQAKHPLHVYLTNGELAHFGSNQMNSVGQYAGIGLGQALANNTTYQKIAIVAEGRDSGSYISNLHFLVDTAADSGSAVLADSKMMIAGNNGYVGIGITSPSNLLHVHAAGSSDIGISITNGNYDYTLGIDHSDSSSFKLSRHVGLGNYDLVKFHPTNYLATFVSGISMNNETASANQLDDYEEGTWTPLLKNNANNSAATMSMQIGWYTKVGNLVTVGGSLVWSSNGSNANGGYTVISGLPFAAHDTANTRNGGCLGAVNGFTVADDESLSLVVDPSASFAYVVRQDSGTYHHNNTIAASGAIYGFLITYHV